MNTFPQKTYYFKGPGMLLLNSENWNPALHPRNSIGEFRYNGGRHRRPSSSGNPNPIAGGPKGLRLALDAILKAKIGDSSRSGQKGATNVVGTVFGGPYDPNASAYTGKTIDPNQLGAALPFKFPHHPGQLPGVYIKITSKTTRKSTIAPIVDLGPHKGNNPYWDIPNGDPTSGDRRNRSGLDMTPATARALGLPVSHGSFRRPPAINTSGDEHFDFEFVPAPGKK